MAQRQTRETVPPNRPSIRLVASHGKRLPSPVGEVAPINAPESTLEIEFEGITPAQQRAALAAFPGGRRFVLKH